MTSHTILLWVSFLFSFSVFLHLIYWIFVRRCFNILEASLISSELSETKGIFDISIKLLLVVLFLVQIQNTDFRLLSVKSSKERANSCRYLIEQIYI